MKGKPTCNNISMMDYFLLSSPVFSLIKLFDVLDFNYFLMSTVVCVLVYMLQWTILLRIPLIIVVSRLRMPNRFTTKKTCLSVSSDVEKFDELQSLLSNMNQQGTKTCINEVIDKICDLFKCTAKWIFPTKNRNSPCNKSDKPWFNKSCLEKRKKFHTAKNRYSFVKNKETCKEFKQEMNKSYKNHQQKLENELRKTSKQDSKTFGKILNGFGKKGTDKNIKITIDQF